MTTIFLSHSSRDKEEARRLKRWLEAEDRAHRVFLDDDLESGIRSGANWEQALYQQLRLCRVFLPLFTANWVESKWCFAEMTHARASGKLILPVKLDPVFDTSALFSELQGTLIDLGQPGDAGFRRLDRALREEFHWSDPQRAPYPGLLAFQEGEEAIYRGRDAEIHNALETLEGLRRRGRSAPHFVLLLGASGSGKSSLVRAGLVPRLRRNAGWLPLPPFVPRSNPLAELAEALSSAFERAGSPRSFASLEQLLIEAAATTPADGKVLLQLARDLRIASRVGDGASLLLVIDQAEELFSVNSQQQVGGLLALLRAAIEQSDGRLMVLATMRSEFLGAFQHQHFLIDPGYPEPFAYTEITLDPMPTERFREIICGPADLAGLVIDEDLVERMIADTGTRDALPLLAYTLRRLWDKEDCRRENRIRLRDYQEIGGIEGSIRKAADEALDAGRRRPAELEAIRGAFVPAMVRLTPEGEAVRQRVPRDELPDGANDALKPFVENRLLITNKADGRETVEVAHEALLRVWRRLTDWMDEDRDKLRLFEGLRRAARDWLAGEADPELLIHHGDRLQELLALVSTPRFRVKDGSTESRYLVACNEAHRERERRQREESERRIRDAEQLAAARARTARVFKRWLAVAGLFGVLALAGALVATYFWEESETQAGLADQRARLSERLRRTADLATLGDLMLDRARTTDEASTAALLVNEALKRSPGSLQAQLAWTRVLEYYPAPVTSWEIPKIARGNAGAIAAFSQDGRYLALSEEPGWNLRVIDLANGQTVFPVDGDSRQVNAVAFNASGSLLVTGNRAGQVQVLEVPSWQELKALKLSEPVQTVAFIEHGRQLAVAGEQRALQIRAVGRWEQTASLRDRAGDTMTVEFSPDGQWIAALTWHTQIEENVVRIRDLKTGHTMGSYIQGDPYAIALSSDGRYLAVNQSYGLRGRKGPRVWIYELGVRVDSADFEIEATRLDPIPIPVRSAALAFGPFGKRLAIGSPGGGTHVVATRGGRELAKIDQPGVDHLAFLNGGDKLGAAGSGRVMVWDFSAGRKLAEALVANNSPLDAAQFDRGIRDRVKARIGRELSAEERAQYVPDVSE